MADSFEFSTYTVDLKTLQCSFEYIVKHNDKTYEFREVLELHRFLLNDPLPEELIQRIGLYLHITLGLSYYKLFAPETIILKQKLSREESHFFTQLYAKGLGEFYYRNNLDLKRAPQFPFDPELTRKPFDLRSQNPKSALVGIGGGKDSIVALELLKEQGHKVRAFVLETQKPYPVIDAVVRTTGVSALKVKRIIDPKLFESIPDSYNGHIPISAIYSFTAYLCAVLYGFSYVVVGNEHSSNFGNIEYQGMEINHQWSKSSEYEVLFQNLANSSLTPDVTYFSLLRPFHEIRIVEMFTRYPQYFNQFTSCNRGFKITSPSKSHWCGECAKCVFVFLLFSAFLKPDDIIKMFGQNLYRKENLLPLFKDVIGKGTMKPFDCVGTFEEAQTALQMAHDVYNEFPVFQELYRLIKPSSETAAKVFHTSISPTVPHQFRLSGMKKALIVGYGKEGKASEEYLIKKYPQIQIAVADEKTHPENFKNQEQFDIALRSPGVHKHKIKIQYTTGTNLFLARHRDTTVGVTGTKGKSTVVSLIGHILSTADKRAEVRGNIGSPLIEVLTKEPIGQKQYIVELSSYQLDDLSYSPHLSVVTSLYDDHLDYHGDKRRYSEAKKQITSHHRADDIYIYNDSFEELKSWTKTTRARAKPYERDLVFEMQNTKLKGEHNKDNIYAAVTVCRELGLSDEQIKKGVMTFVPLAHRMQYVGRFKEVEFYDDAIAVIPEATIAALKSLDEVDTILLGGTDRGYDFSELEKVVKEKGVRNIVLFPDTGKRMFLNHRDGFTILETDSMKEAVEFCFKYTKKGAVCLLSTASPSYRLWKSFEEKGDEFQKYVKKFGSDT